MRTIEDMRGEYDRIALIAKDAVADGAPADRRCAGRPVTTWGGLPRFASTSPGVGHDQRALVVDRSGRRVVPASTTWATPRRVPRPLQPGALARHHSRRRLKPELSTSAP